MDDDVDISNLIENIIEQIDRLGDFRYLYNAAVDDELANAIECLRNAQECLF